MMWQRYCETRSFAQLHLLSRLCTCCTPDALSPSSREVKILRKSRASFPCFTGRVAIFRDVGLSLWTACTSRCALAASPNTECLPGSYKVYLPTSERLSESGARLLSDIRMQVQRETAYPMATPCVAFTRRWDFSLQLPNYRVAGR